MRAYPKTSGRLNQKSPSASSSSGSRLSATPWWTRQKIGGRKVSRSISPDEQTMLHAGWNHSWRRGTGLNRDLFFQHAGIDQVDPLERCLLWEGILKELEHLTRKRGYEYVALWIRKSCSSIGTGEHL